MLNELALETLNMVTEKEDNTYFVRLGRPVPGWVPPTFPEEGTLSRICALNCSNNNDHH